MALSIQTSMFSASFPPALAASLRAAIADGAGFAFVASEFEKAHEKTDRYFALFREKFEELGIKFGASRVVDGRMTPDEARRAVMAADVVWLSGGDTPAQWAYFEKYGIVDALKSREGVTIGMSAGAINMAETAVYYEHGRRHVYPALGLVSTTIEPHFTTADDELLALSRERVIYGLCDEAAIVWEDGKVTFIGDVFRLENGRCEQISRA